MNILLNGVVPVALAGLLVCGNVLADVPKISLTIKNQRFTPEQIQVPAHTKVEILVKNEDRFPAEFESADLSREVVVPGGSTVSVFVGPLSPGRYNFFNDFNHAAKGWVVSTPQPSK
ncbi:MAG: cupredoxin domain-containing protein [Acidiferrobacterales bacterium]